MYQKSSVIQPRSGKNTADAFGAIYTKFMLYNS